jgi:hypothetical protein
MSVDQFLLSADTTDLNYPEIRPTLDLNFARTKVLDPRITFTRSSGGSYIGPDGLIKYAGVNEPRFDHDPATGESLGLLIEEARTNLMAQSENLTTWGKPSGTTIIPNAIIAPDGTLTAEKIVEDKILGQHYVFRTFSITPGVTYTVSGYVKSAERNEVFLNFSSFNGAFDNNSFAYFNTTTGRFRLVGTSVTNHGFQSLPNGWYRIWITATSVGTANPSIISPFHISNGTANFYIGDGASGLYIWGAQLEQASFPTSYIPTQASTRTRAADSASITGKNFSEWYRQDEGTLYANAKSFSNINVPFIGVAAINNPTSFANNRVDIRYNPAGASAAFFNSPTSLSRPTAFNLINPKFAVGYKKNIARFCLNESLAIGNPQNFTPSENINTLQIGRFDNFSHILNGQVSKLTYYPKLLPDSQLIALTR